ncbi:MAG TPA: DUF2569 family protein, partial [Blastocatellia bacterium]|nr:DUF2569 family protein [Blastocatellia bacterium]
MGTLFQTPQEAASEYRGVKGWLLFFCISLTILSPLITLGNLASGCSAASRVADRLPALMTATGIDSVLAVLVMALGIFAGVSLWTVRPNAVPVAKLYLIVLPVYAVFEIALFLAILPPRVSDALTSRGTISVLRSLCYAGLWFAYLSRSKRVKATYFESEGYGSEYNGSEYIGLNLSRPAPRDPARDAPPQQPKTGPVEPVNQADPISEEKPGRPRSGGPAS